MVLVLIAALLMALLFAVFKVFERRNVPLLPAIVINYLTAFAWGAALSLPWNSQEVKVVLAPALGLGALFIVFFYITGVATQRVGVAISTVAGKMSLVLTVLFAVAVFGDRPGTLGWCGIVLAFAAVLASAWPAGNGSSARASWWLPALLFFGTALVDITLNTIQREVLTPPITPLFQSLVFASAGAIGLMAMARGGLHRLGDHRALIGGIALGTINYASVHAIIGALDRSGFPPSSVFPLMNIGVILFGTAMSVTTFGERLRPVQWAGVATAVIAMALILSD